MQELTHIPNAHKNVRATPSIEAAAKSQPLEHAKEFIQFLEAPTLDEAMDEADIMSTEILIEPDTIEQMDGENLAQSDVDEETFIDIEIAVAEDFEPEIDPQSTESQIENDLLVSPKVEYSNQPLAPHAQLPLPSQKGEKEPLAAISPQASPNQTTPTKIEQNVVAPPASPTMQPPPEAKPEVASIMFANPAGDRKVETKEVLRPSPLRTTAANETPSSLPPAHSAENKTNPLILASQGEQEHLATAQGLASLELAHEGSLHREMLNMSSSSEVRFLASASLDSPITRAELSPRIIQQLVETAKVLPDRPVEITLSPEELGKVRLSFQLTENNLMQVNVAVERNETLEMLKRHIDSLAREFLEMGYENSEFSFTNFEENADQQRHEHKSTEYSRSENPEALQITLSNPIQIGSSKVDIRL